MARIETVVSVLLSDPPPVLDRADREPAAWITDPDLRASIKDGLMDLPDWEAP